MDRSRIALSLTLLLFGSSGAWALPKMKDLVATQATLCGVSLEGKVLCSTNHQAWKDVLLEDRIKTLSARADSVCALSEEGRVYCWGEGINGIFEKSKQPQEIELPEGAKAEIFALAQDRACVAREDQTLLCWGNSRQSRLGVDFRDEDLVWESMGGRNPRTLGNFYREVRYFYSFLSRRLNRDVRNEINRRAEERNQRFNQALAKRVIKRPKHVPSFAPGLGQVVALEMGRNASCAQYESGEVHCWGSNESRELLSDERERYYVRNAGRRGWSYHFRDREPLSIPGVNIIGIAKSISHACVVSENESLYCFGDNGERLGTSKNESLSEFNARVSANVREVKFRESDLAIVSKVFVGPRGTCVVNPLSQVLCFGENLSRGKALTSDQADFYDLSHDEVIEKIVFPNNRICALTEEGSVYCDEEKVI